MTGLHSPDAEDDREGFVRTSDGKAGSLYVEYATQFAPQRQCKALFSWESGHQSGGKAQARHLYSQEPRQVSVPRVGRVAMHPGVNTSGVR